MNISKRHLRQMQSLENVCDFDFKEKIATIQLNYESVDEILDEHLSKPGKPVVSDEVSEYLSNLIAVVPKWFNVDFSLHISDYGDYKYENVLKALNANLENTFYYYDDSRKSDNVLSVIFILIGLAFLALNVISCDLHWFGPEGSMGASIFESLFDIAAWVFVWEGGAILFLTYDEDSTLFRKELKRFYALQLKDKDGNLLYSADSKTLYNDWINVKKGESFSRNFILISSTFILAITCILSVEYIGSFGILDTTEKILFPVLFGFAILGTSSNISFYLEKGKLREYALLLSCCLFFLNAIYVIFGFIVSEGSNISVPVIASFLCIILAINIGCLIYLRKQNISIDEVERRLHREHK